MLTIDEATKRVTIPQSYLTFVSGSLYELDTEQFRTDMNDLMDDERYIWMDDYAIRNAPVTVAGVTLAQTIEMTNGWSLTYENLSMSVRLANSNNNLFDAENGVLINQPLVNVIGQNSAGLQQVSSGSGLSTAQDERLERVEKFLRNRQYTNPVTGKIEQYDDSNTSIEYEADIYSDDGSTAYDGTAGIERRDRFETP